LLGLLLYELGFTSLESFLASQAAKMVGFALISDFELCRVFIENHAADWVSEHFLGLNLMEDCVFRLLWLVVKKPSL
jgi:hypothetical protein